MSKFLNIMIKIIGIASVGAAIATPIIQSTKSQKDDKVLDKVNSTLNTIAPILNAIALNPQQQQDTEGK